MMSDQELYVGRKVKWLEQPAGSSPTECGGKVVSRDEDCVAVWDWRRREIVFVYRSEVEPDGQPQE
jgi:hypothetical protein